MSARRSGRKAKLLSEGVDGPRNSAPWDAHGAPAGWDARKKKPRQAVKTRTTKMHSSLYMRSSWVPEPSQVDVEAIVAIGVLREGK